MQKTETLYQLIWMSRPLMQAAERAVEAGLAGTGLTVRMRAVLEILLTHGDQTVPDLAQRLEIQRQYVQLMANETLSTGLTEQKVNPRHKRSSLLSLTAKGRALIEAVTARELQLVEALATDLDSKAVETALEIIRAVTERLKTQGAAQ